MVIVLSVILAAVALLAVAAPILLKLRRSTPATTSASESLEELMAQRDAAFQALRDLGFDRQVGKVTDEDFIVFEANLKQVAANSLAAVDAWEKQADNRSDELLERKIAARRAALSAPGQICPSCGRVSAAGDAFCGGCGRPLPAAAAQSAGSPGSACPHCGKPYEDGDRFCAGCGRSLPLAAARSQRA